MDGDGRIDALIDGMIKKFCTIFVMVLFGLFLNFNLPRYHGVLGGLG